MSTLLTQSRSETTETHTPKTNLRITVLSGGPSAEREVSLQSGAGVAAALERLGHQVVIRDINAQDLGALDREADCVFIALHGEFGEDGQVQRLLEARNLPYCGSGAKSSALAMNKAATKARLSEAGIPTPRYEIVHGGRAMRATATSGDGRRGGMGCWRLPAVIKPVHSGSSVDVFIAKSAYELQSTVDRVLRTNAAVMIEDYVRGPELTVGILGDVALPVCQIRTKREFYDYQAKYIDDDTEYLFDIDLPDELLREVQRLSLSAHRALGCRHFSRVDWMVDGVTHKPHVLEINTIPGFTSHSLLPKAAARVGISFDELCQRIVELALNSATSNDSTNRDATNE